MNNFYYIDKPINFTSFDVVRVLKKKLNIKKIWHTGTLDPLATGGLLVATGNYTKLIPYLEKDSKEYEFDIMLDGVTESFDLWEPVEFLTQENQEVLKKSITPENIQEILKNRFTGRIEQVPPKYSALKINGQRAYKLAREWKEVEMKKRSVEIFDIELLEFEYPRVTLRAHVSAGTYIRSIAADMWEILGTGGYISRLRRTKIGRLDISISKELDSLTDGDALDIKELFNNHSFITLEEPILEKLNHWLSVKYSYDHSDFTDQHLFVLDDSGSISNIVWYDGEALIPIKKI